MSSVLILILAISLFLSPGYTDEVFFTQCDCERDEELRFEIVKQRGFSASTHLVAPTGVSCLEGRPGVFVDQELENSLEFPVVDEYFANGTNANWYIITRMSLTSTEGNNRFLVANYRYEGDLTETIFVEAMRSEETSFSGIRIIVPLVNQNATVSLTAEIDFKPEEEVVVMFGQATRIGEDGDVFGPFACISTQTGSACEALWVVAEPLVPIAGFLDFLGPMEMNYLLVERDNGLEAVVPQNTLNVENLRDFFNRQSILIDEKQSLVISDVTVHTKVNESLTIDIKKMFGLENFIDIVDISVSSTNSSLDSTFSLVANKIEYISAIGGLDRLSITISSNVSHICLPPAMIKIEVSDKAEALQSLQIVDERRAVQGVFPELVTSCDAAFQPIRSMAQVGESAVGSFQGLDYPEEYSLLPFNEDPCQQGELLQLQFPYRSLPEGKFDVVPFKINDVNYSDVAKAPETKKRGLVKLIVTATERSSSLLTSVVRPNEDVEITILFPENADRNNVTHLIVHVVPDPSLGFLLRQGESSEEKFPVIVGDSVSLQDELIFRPVQSEVTVGLTGKTTDLIGNEIKPFCPTFPDAEGRCPAVFAYEIVDFTNRSQVKTVHFFLQPSEPSKLTVTGDEFFTLSPGNNPGGKVELQNIYIDGGPKGNLFNATMFIVPTLVVTSISPEIESRRFRGKTVGSMVTVTTEGPNDENLVFIGPPSYLEEIIGFLEVKVDVSTDVGRRQLSIAVFSATSSEADDLLRINFEVSGNFDEDSASSGAIVAAVIGVIGIAAMMVVIGFHKWNIERNDEIDGQEDEVVDNAETTDTVEIDL